VFRVRCHPTTLSEVYFIGYLQTSRAKAYFLQAAKRTTNLASINRTQLGRLPVPLPPAHLQRTYAERVADIRGVIAEQERALAASEALVDSLMARLLEA
jgi:type I restriction enzyme, S subunit